MATEGQKVVTEYRGFTITEKYFKQDPYREHKVDPKNKKKRYVDVGWSFGIYGVRKREIIYYTAWSHAIFFKDAMLDAMLSARNMIDSFLGGEKMEEISVVKLPEIVKE